MAKRLLGKEVNEALVAALQGRTAALREKGVVPTLGIIRLGENHSGHHPSGREPLRPELREGRYQAR